MKIKTFIGLLSFFVLSPPLQAINPSVANIPSQSASAANNPINLNTADVKTLSKSMKGIGVKRAQAIVTYRESHQGFKSVEELAQVPGLGKNFVEHHKSELERRFTVEK
jgi:competence protein ComEA